MTLNSGGSVIIVKEYELFTDKDVTNELNLQKKCGERITSNCVICNIVLDNFIVTSYSNSCEHFCYKHFISHNKEFLEKKFINVKSRTEQIMMIKMFYDSMMANIYIVMNYNRFMITLINKIFNYSQTLDLLSDEDLEFENYLDNWLITFVSVIPKETIEMILCNIENHKIKDYFNRLYQK